MISTIKQGDTYPPLRAYLHMASGKPIRLSGATVKLIAIDEDGNIKINRSSTIVDEDSGYVEYRWVKADTQTVGEYKCEFEITLQNGSVVSVPNNDYFIINIVKELG